MDVRTYVINKVKPLENAFYIAPIDLVGGPYFLYDLKATIYIRDKDDCKVLVIRYNTVNAINGISKSHVVFKTFDELHSYKYDTFENEAELRDALEAGVAAMEHSRISKRCSILTNIIMWSLIPINLPELTSPLSIDKLRIGACRVQGFGGGLYVVSSMKEDDVYRVTFLPVDRDNKVIKSTSKRGARYAIAACMRKLSLTDCNKSAWHIYKNMFPFE